VTKIREQNLTNSPGLARGRALRRLPIAPHILFFFIYNLCYYIPLLAVFLWGYSEGGTEDVVGMGQGTMLRISGIYLAGFCAFFLGSSLRTFLVWCTKGRTHSIWSPKWFDVTFGEKIIASSVLAIFLLTKIALIPTGVYSEYAFDASLMDGPVWNFSMFCSETLVLLAILALFSKFRHNVQAFCFISVMNGANLLHGTRIFMISTIMSIIAYAYIRGLLPFRRVLLYGPPVFVGVLSLTYLIYLTRTSSSLSGAFSPAKLLSPIMYESMFSQLSLITTVNTNSVWELTGHAYQFFTDLILFVSPRILIPNKDSLLFLRHFDYLSPKGAFNGYAIGLIYLGIFSPVFYFILGFIADCLYAASRKSAWWFILYVFYTADFLLHIMRDGYLIPIKMLINTVQWIGVFIAFRWFLKLLASARNHGSKIAQLTS
jgi:hypothetical protein